MGESDIFPAGNLPRRAFTLAARVFERDGITHAGNIEINEISLLHLVEIELRALSLSLSAAPMFDQHRHAINSVGINHRR